MSEGVIDNDLTNDLIWEPKNGFDDLECDLSEIVFTVFDLETTGASPASGAMITEFGAVKVRGCDVLAEFQTLVNPQSDIPPFITALTGITNHLVATAPGIDSALRSFLEFAEGSVLVAHNAPFDVGFLAHFALQQQLTWPSFKVLDTVSLARDVLSRDEVPNHKLATLARFFSAETTPHHRALADARATVDVLHGLFARLGGADAHRFEKKRSCSSPAVDHGFSPAATQLVNRVAP